MTDTALIKTGIIGAVITAICCATPVLAILLGVVGLSAFAGYIDYVVLPALAVSLGVIGYGVYQRQHRGAANGSQRHTNETLT